MSPASDKSHHDEGRRIDQFSQSNVPIRSRKERIQRFAGRGRKQSASVDTINGLSSVVLKNTPKPCAKNLVEFMIAKNMDENRRYGGRFSKPDKTISNYYAQLKDICKHLKIDAPPGDQQFSEQMIYMNKHIKRLTKADFVYCYVNQDLLQFTYIYRIHCHFDDSYIEMEPIYNMAKSGNQTADAILKWISAFYKKHKMDFIFGQYEEMCVDWIEQRYEYRYETDEDDPDHAEAYDQNTHLENEKQLLMDRQHELERTADFNAYHLIDPTNKIAQRMWPLMLHLECLSQKQNIWDYKFHPMFPNYDFPDGEPVFIDSTARALWHGFMDLHSYACEDMNDYIANFDIWEACAHGFVTKKGNIKYADENWWPDFSKTFVEFRQLYYLYVKKEELKLNTYYKNKNNERRNNKDDNDA